MSIKTTTKSVIIIYIACKYLLELGGIKKGDGMVFLNITVLLHVLYLNYGWANHKNLINKTGIAN